MAKRRKRFSREFKAKVALEALKEQLTIAQLAQKYDLHSNQMSAWKISAKDIWSKYLVREPKRINKKL